MNVKEFSVDLRFWAIYDGNKGNGFLNVFVVALSIVTNYGLKNVRYVTYLLNIGLL